jgi:predicted RNase H-like nuclease (RuvC/YqgF family)
LELQNLRTTISGLETRIREFESANGSLIEENRAFSSRLQQNDFQSSEVQNLRTTISGLEKAYETEIHNLKGRIESLKN